MAEVGGDFWQCPHLNPLLKQGHLEQLAQDHVQMATSVGGTQMMYSASQKGSWIYEYDSKMHMRF